MKSFFIHGLILMLVTGALSACNTSPSPEEVSPMESMQIRDEAMPSEAMDHQSGSVKTLETSPSQQTEEVTKTLRSSNKYQSPGGLDDMALRISVKEGVITDVSVGTAAQNETSTSYLQNFNKNIRPVVLGKKLDELTPISTLGGASLSTKAFNIALADIQKQAN